MSSPARILIADPIAEAGIQFLQDHPQLEAVARIGISREDLLADAANYEGIIVRSQTTIDAEVIEAASNLRCIGRAGVGVDNIDVQAATNQGVLVMNTPGGNTISTAEHAFSLMAALARRIPQAHASVVAPAWKRKDFVGTELNGKTLVIVGMGRIGSEFAKRALAFNMRVVAYDPYLSPARARNLRVELAETLEEALAQADFITLHMPLTEETKHLINRNSLAQTKAGARLINCARGPLVDEEALLEALQSGHLAGAALDVYEVEPPREDHPLFSLPQVVLTPHLGASTSEAQENVGIEIAEVIAEHLLSGEVRNALNMPNTDPETLATVGPYLKLATALGQVLAEIAPPQREKLTISFRGTLAAQDTSLISRAAIQGFIQEAWGKGAVNYINAPSYANKLGLEISESKLTDPGEYTDLIELTASCGELTHIVAGCFFGESPRIVRIDDHRVEVPTEGNLLLIENQDTPGIVGKLGMALAAENINIAHLSLARDEAGGKALSVYVTDQTPQPELLESLTQQEPIISAKVVNLSATAE